MTDLPEKTGSWDNRYYPLIKFLKKDNFVLVLNPNRNGHSHNVINLSFKSLTNTIYYLFNLFLKDYDLILLLKPLPVSSFCCSLSKFIKRNIHIHLDYDDYEFDNNFYFKNKLLNYTQRKIIYFFEKNINKFSDTVSTHNNFLKKKLINNKFSNDKIIYFPNFLYLNEDIGINNKIKNNNNFIISYFGEINDSTGHSLKLIFDSYDLITIDKFKIFIYGDGPDLNKYKSIVKSKKLKNIYFKGRFKKNKLFLDLQKSKLIIEPIDANITHNARFPIKMVESLYLGIPYLTAKVGVRVKILGNNFIFYQKNNSVDLALKILMVYNNYSKYLKIFDTIRDKNKNLFDEKKVLSIFTTKLEKRLNI